MFVPKTNYTAVKIIKLVIFVIQTLIHPVKNKRNIGHKNLLVFSVVQYSKSIEKNRKKSHFDRIPFLFFSTFS